MAVGAAVGTNGTGIVFCPTGVAAVAYEIPAATPITTPMLTTTTATAPRRSFFERSDELRYFQQACIVVVKPMMAVSNPITLLKFTLLSLLLSLVEIVSALYKTDT